MGTVLAIGDPNSGDIKHIYWVDLDGASLTEFQIRVALEMASEDAWTRALLLDGILPTVSVLEAACELSRIAFWTEYAQENAWDILETQLQRLERQRILLQRIAQYDAKKKNQVDYTPERRAAIGSATKARYQDAAYHERMREIWHTEEYRQKVSQAKLKARLVLPRTSSDQ